MALKMTQRFKLWNSESMTCTYPLSEALTMYCLSLLALALDKQVTEAVCPNRSPLGLICKKSKSHTHTKM